MADKCCNSNSDAENEENRTDSCCSSTNLEIKQENTSCCSSNKDSVNSFNSIPIFIQTETSCCSSNTSKETDKELEKKSCCSNSLPSEKKQETTNCCSSKTTIKEDETLVKTSCCSSTEQQTIETISNALPSGEKMAYRVHGMDCPACAKTIEKSLSTLKDISEVKVNYSTAKMQVAASHLDAFIPIESEIKKLGYSIEPLDQKGNIKTFEIEGMDCGSCAKSIENHLNTLSTVKNVSVNFSTGKMKIEHSDSAENIISEVSKIGFKASLQSNKKSIQTNKNKSDNGLIILSGVLIALGFIGSFNGISPIMSTILYAIAMVISGYKPVKSAFYAIKSRSLDMNVLMSVAAIGAALIGEWLEGATVVWLFAIGNILQTKSIERTRNSIRNLMDLAPPEAWVRVGSEIIKKSVEEITIGDVIIVKPGDKIPLDGEIIQGESSVNQAPITGESIPVDKEIGDTVYAGTINENGSLEIKVTKLVEDTTISKIIHLVEEAQEQKAPTEAFVDKFASVYTPIVFILALAIMLLPPLLGFGTWGDWFYKGLELLVVACPCALVISTPVAIVSAIGNAAKNGVLIKGGTFLEKAGAITAIAFDKTGTLTEGKPKVTEIQTLHVTEDELLSIALTLEDYSTHPIAKAIVEYANEKGIQPKIGELFRSIVGKGVQATIEGNIYYGGNLKLFEEMNVSLDDAKNHVQDLQNKGKTVVVIGTQHQVIGIIAVSDTIRETTASALKALKQSGVNQTVMLTGDNEGSAKIIASEANVTRYFADLLPEDKVDAIKKLQNEGHKVAMVGDGINDAPALATADLGIAMGGAGTDTAMETADIVLMADNLDKLPHTMKLSRKALTIIKQNIWFSVIIKVIALVLIFPGWLTLWMAVLSDTGAALIVILNALRLLKFKE
ncbi:heavy metal translocating P-type ATPase [Peribacillus simplex]|uniref:heavy metal translocating P-type ATPase n=1 Tax=Peribacillus simplex TaxID=1478 RepID=UPI00298D7E70|nr:heavy metal translocating P-type ATPase [Peribacillus simplex]MDW7613858.1 heavy metal translocating P-type ATPase [Peribacillus simplex]